MPRLETNGFAWVACVLILNSTASAQSAPAYVADLAAFEVRELAGSYAPIAGGQTIESVTPADWSNDFNIVSPWSGGFKSISGTKLWVHGGGHNDSANNGIYAYDFSGTDRPKGFELIDISARSAVRPASDDANGSAEYADYLDGRPHAIHGYDGLVHAHHNGFLYRFGGAHYNGAGGTNRFVWKFNLAAQTWTQLPDIPGGGFASTIYDPETGKIMVRSGDFQVAFLRTADETWSPQKTVSAAPGFDICNAWDPTRDRGIEFGNDTAKVWTVDFAAETVQSAVVAPTGATEILDEKAPSAFYDAALDVYWLVGGQSIMGGSSGVGWDSLYRVDAETFAITKHPLGGDSINEQTQWGSYGRFVFLAPWRAIGIVAGDDSAAYIVRLPEGETLSPQPPTDLTVVDD